MESWGEREEQNWETIACPDQIYVTHLWCILYYIRLYYLINLCCLCISIFRPTKTYFVFYFKHHILGKAFLLLVTVQINWPMKIKMSCTIGIIIHLHLTDAFIQSDLQCIQAIHLYCQYVCSLGIEPTTFALLTQCSNHWATGTLCTL